MSLASALLGTRAAAPTRPADRSSGKRDLHIAVAKARLLFGRSEKDVCRAFDVSRRTVQLWTQRALKYEGAIPDALRRAHAGLN